MANIKLNPVFEGMSKQIGDLVFYKRNGRTFIRRKGDYTNPNTEAQKQVRSAFAELSEIWCHAGDPVQSAWDEYAKDERYTGYNAFIGQNAAAQREGRPIKLVPDAEELTGFSAGSCDSGEIKCTVLASSPRVHVTLFLQKVEEAAGCGALRRRDFCPGSECILSGLESGAYHVYAVTTDAPYDEATGVTSVAVQTVSVS